MFARNLRTALLGCLLALGAGPVAAQLVCAGTPPLRSEKGPYRVPGYDLTSEEVDAWYLQLRAACEWGEALPWGGPVANLGALPTCNAGRDSHVYAVIDTGSGAPGIYQCDGASWNAAGGGAGAPTDAEYITTASNGTLSAERVLQAGTNTTVTTGAGTVQVDVSGTLPDARVDGAAESDEVAMGGDVTGPASAAVVGDDTHAHTGSTISALDAADTTTGTFADARISASSVTQHETALEAVLDLPDQQGQISDAQIADGAVDGGLGGEIADGSVTADDLGADSVSASELDAAGVEVELEAVLDLADLQGAVTDGQVPDTLTASNYAPLAGATFTGPVALDNAQTFKLFEADANGSHSFTLTAPASLTGDTTCTIAADGRIPDSCVGDGTDGTGTDDQAASEVPFAPAGTIAASDVQAAIEEVASEAGGGTPGGSDTQVQYNDGGAFGGEAGFVYDEATDTPTLGAAVRLKPGAFVDQTFFGGASGLELRNNANTAAVDLAVRQLMLGAPASNGTAPHAMWRAHLDDLWTAANFILYWSATAGAADGRDTSLYRHAAGVVGVGNGGSPPSPAGLLADYARLPPRSSPPVTCGSANTGGTLYMDSDSDELCVCQTGGSWVGLIAGGACS